MKTEKKSDRYTNANPIIMEILLITSQYPYNCGDVVFIKPEMPFLSRAFDKVHVMYTDSNAVSYNKIDVPANVAIIPPPLHDLRGTGKKYRRSRTLFISFFHPFKIVYIFMMELWSLLVHKKICTQTFKTAMNYILDANFYMVYLKKYLHENPEIRMIYTYWFERKTFAFLIYKKYFNKHIKCITRAHGYDLYEFQLDNNYQPYKRWMDKYIDSVFFVSKAGRDYYLNLFAGTIKNKYFISKLGIENKYKLKELNMNEYPEGLLNIVSCSYIIPRKRIHIIIMALSSIKTIPINWIHIGDGNERNNIENLALQLLGNNNNIKYNFLGHFDNDSIKEYYYNNNFDCFISTTEAEGGNPVSMMEAISFGIPIIASNVGGIPEVVNKDTGILLDPDNCVEELASALHRFSSMTSTEKQTLRKSCRKYWEDNYMAEKQYSVFVDNLKNIF